MDGLPWVTVLTIASALLVGLLLAQLAALKIHLANRHDVSNRSLSQFLLLIDLELLPLLLLAGLAVDLWGVRPVLILGSVLLAASFFALAAGLAERSSVGVVLFSAAGAGALLIATLVLLPRAFFGTRQLLASLNICLVFVGLGALVSRALAGVLVARLSFRPTMALLGCLALSIAALAAIPDAATLALSTQQTFLLDLVTLFQQPGLWLAAVVFFFYAPLEAAISLWTPVHVVDRFEGEEAARWHLVVFWSAFLFIRLVLGLVEQVGYLGDAYLGWFLVLSPLFAAATLGNLVGGAVRGRAWGSLVSLGLLLGPFVPALLGLVFELQGVRGVEGTALGLLFAAGSLGSILIGPVFLRFRGQPPEHPGSIQASHASSIALRAPLGVALLLTVCSLLFWLLAQRVG
jgi:hypothetical protein